MLKSVQKFALNKFQFHKFYFTRPSNFTWFRSFGYSELTKNYISIVLCVYFSDEIQLLSYWTPTMLKISVSNILFQYVMQWEYNNSPITAFLKSCLHPTNWLLNKISWITNKWCYPLTRFPPTTVVYPTFWLFGIWKASQDIFSFFNSFL